MARDKFFFFIDSGDGFVGRGVIHGYDEAVVPGELAAVNNFSVRRWVQT